jgi:hypothetical protein
MRGAHGVRPAWSVQVGPTQWPRMSSLSRRRRRGGDHHNAPGHERRPIDAARSCTVSCRARAALTMLLMSSISNTTTTKKSNLVRFMDRHQSLVRGHLGPVRHGPLIGFLATHPACRDHGGISPNKKSAFPCYRDPTVNVIQNCCLMITRLSGLIWGLRREFCRLAGRPF